MRVSDQITALGRTSACCVIEANGGLMLQGSIDS